MDEGEKKKKRKEKSSCERQAAKKPMHQQNPLSQENVTWAAVWRSAGNTKIWKHTQSKWMQQLTAMHGHSTFVDSD